MKVKKMDLYWVSWYSKDNAWGFPYHWCSGVEIGDDLTSERTIICAVIAAESEEEAWAKADWAVSIDERRFIEETDKASKGDRFPAQDWWPTPSIVWSNLSDEGYEEEFWAGLGHSDGV